VDESIVQRLQQMWEFCEGQWPEQGKGRKHGFGDGERNVLHRTPLIPVTCHPHSSTTGGNETEAATAAATAVAAAAAVEEVVQV